MYDGQPGDNDIADYEKEVVELLKAGYLGTVTYGFWRDGDWIEPTLRYTARELSGVSDDDPGRVRPGSNVAGASFYSHLSYSLAWSELSPADKSAFEDRLPFIRVGRTEPGVNGYFEPDRTYSSGGRALSRSSVRTA